MDNLYMYGPPEGPMTEETPHRATGPKGRLRAQLAQLLLDAHPSGRLPVAIGRASDFFGRTRNNSVSLLVFETVARKGKASWLGSLDAPRTLSYLPDVAWGLATLAEHPDEAFGQAWHLAAAEPLTGRQFIQMLFEVAGKPLRFNRVTRPTLRLAGLFSPIIREVLEQFYPLDQPFVMDTTKFEKAFGRRVTPYRDAIRATLEWSRG